MRVRLLVSANIENCAQDRSQYVQRAVFVIAVFVLSVIVIVESAVGTVLITTLEALLEIVLVLVSRDMGLIAVGSRAINVRIGPAKTNVAASVVAPRLESLSVALIYSLLKELCSAVVGVVIRTVAVNPVPRISVPIAGSKRDGDSLRVASIISDLALLCRADLVVVSRPVRLTLLHETGTLLFRLRILLVYFFGAFCFFAPVVVAIAVALCARYRTRPDDAEDHGNSRDQKFSKIACFQNDSLSARFRDPTFARIRNERRDIRINK